MKKEINQKLIYFSFLIPFLYLLLLIPGYFPTYNGMFIDSGIYSYVAQEINRGHMLYKEIFEIKFPAIYYIYAFLFKIFPDSRWSLFFLDVISNLLILLFTLKIMKNLKLEKYFWIAGLLLMNTYRVYPAFSGGNLNEHFFLFFFLMTLSLLTNKENKINNFLLGFSFSFLFFFKQPYILFPITLLYFFRKRIFKKDTLKFFSAGFLPVFSFFTYIWVKAYPDSYVATISYPLAWASSVKRSVSDLIYRFKIFLTNGAGKELLLLILPVLIALKPQKYKYFFLWNLIILLIVYVSTPALYSHYFVLIYIPLLIGLLVIFKNYPAYLLIPFLCILTLFPYRLTIKKFIHTRRSLYRFFVEKDRRVRVHPLCFVIFKYVKPGEKFIMIPDYPEVYFITKTESPFRFYGFGCIIPSFFHDELKKDIRGNPPSYVYLRSDLKSFNQMFSLTENDYIMVPIQRNFYRFILKSSKTRKSLK